MHYNKFFSSILFLNFLFIFSCQLYSSSQEVSQAKAESCLLVACSYCTTCTCCRESDCLIQQQTARTRYGICSLGCHGCKECVCFRHNNKNQIEQQKSKLDDVCLCCQFLCCYNCITLCTFNKSENCASCFCDPLCSDNNKKLLCAVTLENCCELPCKENDLCSYSLCCNVVCCCGDKPTAKIKPVDSFKVRNEII